MVEGLYSKIRHLGKEEEFRECKGSSQGI